MKYSSFSISTEEKELLRRKLLNTPEIAPFKSDVKFFSLLAALGIHQEIGTIHDEFSKFLFDGRTGIKIPREKLRSELIRYHDYVGVRIWAEGFDCLDPRVQGMRTLLHPSFSYDESGQIHQCVFFPEVIVQISKLEDTEIVSVKPWGINTIFGGFDPTKSYYEGNMWEFINVDAVRYSRLLENKQIVFWGTHDLVSHIAGVRKTEWPPLQKRGRDARILFENYFRNIQSPVPYALVLPYALGMLLDDLAQPMNYRSESRIFVVELLMEKMRTSKINHGFKPYLLKYPPSIERLILLARSDDLIEVQKNADQVLGDVLEELQRFSFAS